MASIRDELQAGETVWRFAAEGQRLGTRKLERMEDEVLGATCRSLESSEVELRAGGVILRFSAEGLVLVTCKSATTTRTMSRVVLENFRSIRVELRV